MFNPSRTVLHFLHPGVHSQLFAVWGAEAGPFSELLYFTLGLGGTASTFAIKPFLESHVASRSQNTSNTTEIPATTTRFEDNGTPVYNNISDISGTSTSTTEIQWAYLIAGSVSLLASLPFFIEYIAEKCSKDEISGALVEYPVHTSAKSPGRSRVVFIAALALLSVVHMIITGIIDTYAGFIATFTLRHLEWSKQDGALASTVFYVSIACGNLVGMLLSLVMKTRTLFMCSAVCGFLSLAGLMVSGLFLLTPGIWTFDAACGFFLAPLWPTFFTYTEESVTPIAGTVASIFLFLGAAGMSLNPLMIGYTMDTLSPMWFTYVMLTECVIMAGLFAIVMYLYRDGKSKYERV